jgi:SAM-dependent methyltransferase
MQTIDFPAMNKAYSSISRNDIQYFLQEFRNYIEYSMHHCSRPEILDELKHIRRHAAESVFMSHAQTWPLGYQGDYVIIDHILTGQNKTPLRGFGYYLEQSFLESDICIQHHNKVDYQAKLIKRTIERCKNAKILVLGCGTGHDIAQVIGDIAHSEAMITLVDSDERALAFAAEKLQAISSHLAFIHGNMYKAVHSCFDTYDLILIGGVFDYVKDEYMMRTLHSLRHILTDRGMVYFTNINRNHPYKVYMEYLADWLLYERSKSEITELLRRAGINPDDCSLFMEQTGITHMVCIPAAAYMYHPV